MQPLNESLLFLSLRFNATINTFCRQKASKLMNGSSRQKDSASPSSQQRYTGRLALKRRAGAAAKAAEKYADYEVCIFVLIVLQRFFIYNEAATILWCRWCSVFIW